MSEIIRAGSTCQVKQAASGKMLEAAVHEFKDRDRLTVVVNQSVKLFMKWNGKVYEGRMAGLDFISDGPTVKKTQVSIRG
jgi:hypothetical protein